MPDPNTDAPPGETPRNDAPAPVRITLTPDDLKHAYWLIQTKAIVSPIGFLRLFFLGLVTMTATAVALVAIDGKVVWPLAILAGIIGPCALVASVYYRNATGARRIFAQQKSLQLPFTLFWTADHVETDSAQGRALLAWADLRKVSHDRRTILLHESDVLFRIVPRRVLTPEQQADLLRVATARPTPKPAVAPPVD